MIRSLSQLRPGIGRPYPGTMPSVRTALFLVLMLVASAGASGQQGTAPRPVPEDALAIITAERSKQHIDLLASDQMMGRNTPSLELDSAARYIAGHFKAFGLEPVNGSYYNEYKLKRVDLGSATSLKVNGKAFDLKTGFIPFDFTTAGNVAASVVFVGYGISRPEIGFDEYAGMDVQGKIVLVISGEPAGLTSPNASANAVKSTPYAKMQEAARRGAVGVLILQNPAKSRVLRPYGYPWRALYPNLGEGAMPIKLDLPLSDPGLPSVGIGGDVAKAIFGMSQDRIAALVRSIDSTQQPVSRPLKGEVELNVAIEKTTIPARNVVGMVPGRLYPDEVVVVGAHYDHVGSFAAPADAKDTSRSQIDTIYNGADDNASGTTGLLMVAEAFGALSPEQRPARSILVIAFSGEEKGLFGSRAYVAAPLVPYEKTVAMLNMDMIGRNNPDSVSVAGKSRSPELAAMGEEANRAEPMTMAYDLEDMFFRSDQASFAAKQIPSLFFSSGLHPDYHQVSDSPDKIVHGKLAHIARLCFRTAWIVAESPVRPIYDTAGESGAPLFD